MLIFMCQFCGRETTNAGANKAHEKRCASNPTPGPKARSGRRPGFRGENQYTKAEKNGLPKPIISEEERKRRSESQKQRRLSEETKSKISKARQKFLADNPDKVPYKLNHYSKGRSYPERYWKRVFDKIGLDYVEQFQIHTYQLDFALVELKIDIEVDGDQHYLDPRVVQSDLRRNEYLQSQGWRIVRIKWSEYKKLIDKNQRVDYIDSLMKEIWTGTQVDKGN